MQLKTPKRYTRRGQKRRLINLRWLWLYILTPIVVVVGAGIWQNREMLREPIEQYIAEQAQAAADRVATAQAPTPTATDSPMNYVTVANAAYQRGAMDTAIENYDLASNGLPNDVALYVRLAHLLVTNGRPADGIDVALKAINADPYNASAWAIYGMALEWDGQAELAVANILRALELDPNNAEAYSFLAEAYYDQGRYDQAVEAIDIAMELDPNNFNVQRNYGYVMAATDRETAIAAFERALQLEPSRGYVAFNLANLYFAEGETDQGLDLLRSVIDRNPENATAYNALADALLIYAGEVGQAREAVERCTAIAPNNVGCLSTLGALQRSSGEFNLCARTLDRAIEAGSTNPLDYFFGGSCYIVSGDCTRARDILMEGFELAETTETQTDIRDALAQCQVIVTLEPPPTPEGGLDEGLPDDIESEINGEAADDGTTLDETTGDGTVVTE